MIKITGDLSDLGTYIPPTYDQTQDNLPSYDEVTRTSNNAKKSQGY